MLYGGVYLLFFFILIGILDVIINQKKIKILLYFYASLVFYFFVGLGDKIGVDWVEYRDIYSNVSLNRYSYEIGYLLINDFFHRIGLPFELYSLIIKFVYVLSTVLFFMKYCRYPTLALGIYFGFMFPFFNDPLRQLISTSILFILFYFKDNNIKPIGIIFGSLFHISFVSLIFTLFKFIEKNKNKILFYSILLSIISPFLVTFIINNISFLRPFLLKLQYYLETSSVANIYSSLIRVSVLAYVCCSSRSREYNIYALGEKRYKFFWIFTFALLIFEIIFLFIPIITQRLRFYYVPFAIVMIINAFVCYVSVFKRMVIVFIIGLYLSLVLFNFLSKPIGHFYDLSNNAVLNLFITPKENNERDIELFWKGMW